VGTVDIFHDEDVAHATRLKEADVECEVENADFHGFDTTRPKACRGQVGIVKLP